MVTKHLWFEHEDEFSYESMLGEIERYTKGEDGDPPLLEEGESIEVLEQSAELRTIEFKMTVESPALVLLDLTVNDWSRMWEKVDDEWKEVAQ